MGTFYVAYEDLDRGPVTDRIETGSRRKAAEFYGLNEEPMRLVRRTRDASLFLGVRTGRAYTVMENSLYSPYVGRVPVRFFVFASPKFGNVLVQAMDVDEAMDIVQRDFFETFFVHSYSFFEIGHASVCRDQSDQMNSGRVLSKIM